MNEDVTNGGKRRIIIRRRSDGESGNTGATTGGGGNSNAGADSASTVGGGNIDDTERDSELTDEPSDNDRGESARVHSAPGIEGERIRSDGSSRSNGERDGYDELRFDLGGTDSGNSGGADSRGRGTQGKPKRTYRKRQTAKSTLSLEQDTEDVKNIVTAVGDAFRNVTGYDGFTVSEPEALSVARPAARILQRHGQVAETVRTIADPLALIIAAGTVFGPRIAGYNIYRQMGSMSQPVYQEREQTVPPPTSFVDSVMTNERVNPEDTPGGGVVSSRKDGPKLKLDPDLFKQFQQ